MQTLMIFWSSWRLKMIVSERQQIFTSNLLVRIAIILYYLNFYISVTSFWSICSFGFHGVQEHTIEQITTRYWGIYVIHTYMSWTFSWLLTPLAVWVSPSYLCCVQIVRRFYFILNTIVWLCIAWLVCVCLSSLQLAGASEKWENLHCPSPKATSSISIDEAHTNNFNGGGSGTAGGHLGMPGCRPHSAAPAHAVVPQFRHKEMALTLGCVARRRLFTNRTGRTKFSWQCRK